MSAAALLSAVLVLALGLQALLPSRRLLVVSSGAAVSCFLSGILGVATPRVLLATVPWDVIVILVALGLFSELIASTRVFGVLAEAGARWSRADARRILLLFCCGMYAISGLVNNLTALLLVMPIVLILLKLVGAGQRYVTWMLGTLLVACNLGGAATPIGDFPAILLLGRGAMTFSAYLGAALPPTLCALALILTATLVFVRPQRDAEHGPAARALTLAVMGALYRNVRVDRRLFVPLVGILGAMLAAWIVVPATVVPPEVIAWLGAGAALSLRPREGERLVRTRVDFEAVLFLFSLFVMVGAVSATGAFERIARALTGLPWPPAAQLAIFLVLAAVLTGVFSAGPSMAALLEVAESLAKTVRPSSVYVGLALSVCAGSSLFLTAATSGPMAQILVDRAGLRDANGRPVRFGFFQFVPVGLLGFTTILAVGLVYALTTADGR